jgi:hypothetical protein
MTSDCPDKANAVTRARDVLLSTMGAMTQVEKSNGFDSWRRWVNLAAGEIDHTPASGAVFGALLAAVAKADVVDFTADALDVFLEITNMLRMPRLAESDMKQAIATLSAVGRLHVLPLSPDDEDVASVDADISRLSGRNEE